MQPNMSSSISKFGENSNNEYQSHSGEKPASSMFKNQDFLKAKLSEVSAKTISLGGKRFARGRNEQKVRAPFLHRL
jgi:hypothetical protein